MEGGVGFAAGRGLPFFWAIRSRAAKSRRSPTKINVAMADG